MPAHVLIVDDDPAMCELIERDVRRRGMRGHACTSGADALAALEREAFDVVLADLQMPGMDGLELCRRIVAERPEVPVVAITGFGSLESAVAAMRAGAYDFVTKPIELDILAMALERAVQHRSLRDEVRRLNDEVDRAHYDEFIGESPTMRALYDRIARVADSETSVLLCGESGTGKELAARALHRRSRRAEGPFLAVNCAALPEALLESELFGHVKGAFTDARSSRKGLFLQAEGGTLFLDEIGEIPAMLQPKLLRALEERCVRPVGSDQELPFDVRLVAATNRDLQAAVDEGHFREDLFFRINVIQLEMPPLRARGTDVLRLAQHFVETFSARSGRSVKGMSRGVAERLLAHSWPGNVRELRNAMEAAVALTRCEEITVEDLPRRIRGSLDASVPTETSEPDDLVPLWEVERRYVLHVLRATGGNKTRAARTLGVGRKTLYRKLSEYGVREVEEEAP